MPVVLAIQVCENAVIILEIQSSRGRIQKDHHDVSLEAVEAEELHFQQLEVEVLQQKNE